uniref:Protein broad-minded n=1 Tax=Oreochromis niloticus TaxID=8128 RepID=A0A669CLE4_ORENI
MSQLFAEDEVELQSLVKQFLRSISDKISSAPSPECAEEILLHLEETDKDFHNYEFVKYLRQYVENALGSVVEEETNNLTREDGQHAIGSGHDTLIHAVTQRTRDSAEYQQMIHTLKNTMITVVESLKNKFEDDQLRKEEMHHEKQHRQSNIQFTDNCSDSGSSFSQSYGFFRQEQLQVLAEKLDSNKPKEVRWEALKVLCRAPTSDVLSCESWSSLRRNLCVALSEPDPDLSDNALRFFAKSLSSSPLNVTREIYTSLAKSVASSFLSHKLSFPSGSATIDINRPEISRLLKQIRLMNDFQKEVTNFWIRHPEKYMEEVIESTFSLLSYHHEHGSPGTERVLEPVHLLALLDVKATWFKKWMHGYYSRAVILRLLERKYKSVVSGLLNNKDLSLLCTSERPETRGESVYSGKELEYCCFVHSLCVLGKLVIYTNGRKLFPIKIRKYKDPVTLTDLIVILSFHMHLIQLINVIKCILIHLLLVGSDVVSPSTLVMEVLWMLCEQTEWAAECLYQTPVIEKLLAPVILKSPAATLSLIADILARIANTDRGLALFLFEKNLAAAHSERTFAAHIIVQFTQRLLDKELPSLCESDMPHSLCGAFILVCRQMYNTCEGLQVLRPYGLHKALAAAWKKTSTLSERVQTPVPGGDAGSSTQELQNMLIWEETLLDSLLNFAATPKGLLLLQQTGAINECVSYMFSRFTKKLQVSSCEKFGYGVMVTQVAATAPGVVALHSSGFIRALVLELWSVLECSGDNIRVVRPKPTPIDPIDRSCLKSFLYLVNLLSSSQSVWELLGRQPLANKSEYTLREMPTSIPDLIDRLIAMNSDVKIHSLFHYEESHTFGLRLLNVLCCNLDSFLLLESQYNICSMLLQSQMGNNTFEINQNIIIDSLSVERNHVLVRVSVVGGPSERRLPPRDLQEVKGEHPYPWPWFSCYPVPRCYTLDPPDILHTSPDSEISAFLSSWKDPKNDGSWMEACRTLYCKVMASKPSVLTGKGKLLLFVFLLQDKKIICLSKMLMLPQCLLNMSKTEIFVFFFFLPAIFGSLTLKPVTHQEGYPGHDWLASTVFLIMAGNIEKSLCLLVSLSSLLTSAFIWPARIHASIHFPKEVAESGIPPVYWCTAHYVEMLLKAEVPLVHSAFKMSGFTPSQMCLHWLIQCFWNYLDWTEICHYICTCVVMGPDYQVYMCVAIFKHLQPDILQRTQSQELQVFLKVRWSQNYNIHAIFY